MRYPANRKANKPARLNDGDLPDCASTLAYESTPPSGLLGKTFVELFAGIGLVHEALSPLG